MYEICPYGDSAQKDGQSRTSLGSWKGFEENYSFMSFSGGQVCWNGPQRSMRVRPLPGAMKLHDLAYPGQHGAYTECFACAELLLASTVSSESLEDAT